ncbi:hypothetical protein RvY_18777 [Ramazzottius varieornatus]|uniref:Uncharacterized protein n=1 Tax=Ramazzottius varieornatus TaxID=947166 RepID=A0A1D1W709_RAMVA|nr:hypothetical protein RvY_18777 [Ramazzottius varieornatus]
MHRQHLDHEFEGLNVECKCADSAACDPQNLRLGDVGHGTFSQLRYRNLPFEKLIGFHYSPFPERRLTDSTAVQDDSHRGFLMPWATINATPTCSISSTNSPSQFDETA